MRPWSEVTLRETLRRRKKTKRSRAAIKNFLTDKNKTFLKARISQNVSKLKITKN